MEGKIHAIANRGLSPQKVAAQRYYRETTTCPTWNGGGAASGLRDTAPGADGTKIAPLVTKITYIKMDPLIYIRNGFVNPSPMDSHFYAAWTSRHQSSMIPKALKFATLQKKWPPYIPHT